VLFLRGRAPNRRLRRSSGGGGVSRAVELPSRRFLWPSRRHDSGLERIRRDAHTIDARKCEPEYLLSPATRGPVSWHTPGPRVRRRCSETMFRPGNPVAC